MVTERERFHGEVLKRQIVTFNEVEEIIQQTRPNLIRKVIHDVYVAPLIKQNKLMRIRRGLFLGLPLGYSNDQPLDFDKFLLAAKIRGKQGVLAYHSALEFYGCAYNEFNEILLGVKTYFTPFTVGRIEVRPVFLPESGLGIVERTIPNNVKVKVTSRERTFLDCLNHVDYSGGWEECLKSFESLGGLDFKKLIALMSSMSVGQLLIRKAGFILEVLRDHSIYYQDVLERQLKKLESWLSPSKLYIDKSSRKEKNELILRWKLYTPHNFLETNLRGI